MKDNAVIIVVFNPVMPDRPANRSSAAPRVPGPRNRTPGKRSGMGDENGLSG